MTDELLIKRFLSGDQKAFNKLVLRWQKSIYNFCLRYLGDTELAQDVLQSTFLRVYQKLATLYDHAKFTTWIYQIAKNLCFDELKKKNHESLSEISVDDGKGLLSSAIESDNPFRMSAYNDLVQVLRQAMQRIPDEQRLIIILKTYHELKFWEIAEILNIPVNTVKARMYKGLQALKPILTKWQITEE
jgi:RNA polymerase sigma-70 factor (ECF subfamily)